MKILKKVLINNHHQKALTINRKPGEQNILIEIAEAMEAEILILGDFKNSKITSSLNLQVRVQKAGKLNLVESLKGGGQIKTRATVELLAKGASCKVTNMFQAEKSESHDFNILMHHQAPGTKGDILVKAVYQNQARGSFKGLIKIDAKAQHVNSFYKDEILLLDSSQAISNPTLEISANEVKASHASSISNLNLDQIFYLQSRGLDYSQARNLIVAGFFTPALNRLPQAFCQPFLPKEN
jgi:Fe-S cluster assembly protein SufD